jgi:hypothetical protein
MNLYLHEAPWSRRVMWNGIPSDTEMRALITGPHVRAQQGRRPSFNLRNQIYDSDEEGDL